MAKSKKPAPPETILLNKPVFLLPKTGFLSLFCFYGLLLLTAGAGTFGCFYTAFDIPLNVLQACMTGSICALLCTLQFLLPSRWGRWLSLLMTAFWLLALWHNRDDLVEGFKRTVNVVSAAYSEKLSSPLPIFLYLDFVFPIRERYLFTLLLELVEYPFFWLLSWMLVRHKAALGGFALTGLFLLFPLAFSIIPASWALGLLLIFWIFLLLSAPSLRRSQSQKSLLHLETSGAGFIRSSTLALLAVAGLCLFLAYRLCPPETYERPQSVNRLRNSAAQSIRDFSAFKGGGSGFGAGDRVDLSSLGERRYTGKTMLRTRHQFTEEIPGEWEAPQKEYLKGFVGSVYTGRSWERLENTAAEEGENLLAGEKAQTLYSSLLLDVPGGSGNSGSYEISVQRAGETGRAVYSPYGLRLENGESLPEGTDWQDDGCLQASGWFSTPESYAFSAAPPWTTSYLNYRFLNALLATTDCPENVILLPGGYKVKAGVALTEEEEASIEALSNYWSQVEGESMEGDIACDRAALPESMKELYPGGGLDVLNAAERYTDFVYDHYVQLPEDTLAFAKDFLREAGISQPEITDRLTIAREIEYLLFARCAYTLSPDPLPPGEDAAEFFLTESRRGYCVHFATAGVVLLRALGIPARYAEGYVAPVQNGEWVDVPDRNAHAWVELYLSGCGWFPMEMTPAGPEAPAAYEDAGLAEDISAPTPTPSPTPSPTSEPESSQTEVSTPSPTPVISSQPEGGLGSPSPSPGASGKNGPGFSPAWLAVPGGLFLLAFCLWLQRKLRIWARRRAFSQPDRNKAALKVYAYLLKLYRTASRLLNRERSLPPEEIRALALKARFSDHKLTAGELHTLLAFAGELENRLKTELSLPARLKCQYLLALF